MMRNGEYENWDGNTDGLDANEDYMDGPSIKCKIFPVTTSPGPPSSSSTPVQFIEHPVSNLDTLAGVAIRYGVEVADIKRLNGLVTDLQMFALKTLKIPLPGRHPPSPSLSNGYNAAPPARASTSSRLPPRRARPEILNTFESLRVTPERRVSPAMNSLQGYYGLRESHVRRTHSEGFEMAEACENGSLIKPSPGMNPPLSPHRKSRSLSNGFTLKEDETENHVPHAECSDTDSDKPVRRRQKSEADFTSRTPEKLLKEENGTGGWISAMKGKGLALRSKASSRNSLASEAEGATNNDSQGLFSFVPDGLLGVRKSSSTSSLQDPDNNSSISIWSGSIAKPILDGWAKPISRKSKAALD